MKDLLKSMEFSQLGKKKALLIALAGLIALYLDFSFIVKLQWQAIIRLNPQIAQVRNNLASFAKDTARMQDLKTRQAGAKENSSPKVKKVIAKGQMASVLENISRLANNNNVKILKMQPFYEPQAKQESSIGDRLSSCLVNLDLVCDYHNFGRFLADLENAQAFFSVWEFKINRQENDFLPQKVSLALRTYVRK